jgi:hypothetical protein
MKQNKAKKVKRNERSEAKNKAKMFRIARADWSQGRRYWALGIWVSGRWGREGQWVKGGANRVSL